MRMSFARLAAVLLVASASSAMAANVPDFPKKIDSPDDFSEATSQLPPGCNLVGINYTDKGVALTLSCQTKAQWNYGFAIGGRLEADCPADDSKTPYVCRIHKGS